MDARMTFHPACDAARRESVRTVADLWTSGDAFLPLQTSGSTGWPKSLMVPRWAVQQSIEDSAQVFQLAPGQRTALSMDVAGTGGRMMLWRALALEMSLQVLPVSRQVDWEGDLDFLALIPQQALAFSSGQWTRVRTVLLGGAPLQVHEEQALAKAPTTLYHGFGMTETLTHFALRRVGEDPVYRCLPGVTVESVDGALVIHAPSRGVEALQSTDAVTVHDAHSFTWLGRLDGAILSGGKKIFPEEIDRTIAAAFPGHPPGFAGGLADAQWGEALVWYSEPLSDIQRARLITAFEALPSWKRPKHILEGELPLTPSGKWKRKLGS